MWSLESLMLFHCSSVCRDGSCDATVVTLQLGGLHVHSHPMISVFVCIFLILFVDSFTSTLLGDLGFSTYLPLLPFAPKSSLSKFAAAQYIVVYDYYMS